MCGVTMPCAAPTLPNEYSWPVRFESCVSKQFHVLNANTFISIFRVSVTHITGNLNTNI